jgi:hypothetical protein
MRQGAIERWIEVAEARRVCERVVAEEMLGCRGAPTAWSLSRRMQLRGVMKAICHRSAFAMKVRSAA